MDIHLNTIEGFLPRKRYAMFFLLYGALLVIFALILRLADNHIVLQYVHKAWIKQPIFDTPAFLYNLIKLQFAAAIPFAIRLTRHLVDVEKKHLELQAQQTKGELSFLRGQLQPHFLLNTMNSLYSSVMTNKEEAGEMVLKISSLLRFSLYEINGTVALLKEIEYIKHYIDLYKVRFPNSVDISYTVFGNPDKRRIESFLIQPFIENSLKYCQPTDAGQTWVTIQLSIDEVYVIIQIDNSIASNNDLSTKSSFGVGQVNVRRRLELLYPDNHEIKIECNDESYFVYLKIPIS